MWLPLIVIINRHAARRKKERKEGTRIDSVPPSLSACPPIFFVPRPLHCRNSKRTPRDLRSRRARFSARTSCVIPLPTDPKHSRGAAMHNNNARILPYMTCAATVRFSHYLGNPAGGGAKLTVSAAATATSPIVSIFQLSLIPFGSPLQQHPSVPPSPLASLSVSRATTTLRGLCRVAVQSASSLHPFVALLSLLPRPELSDCWHFSQLEAHPSLPP